jgi:hypothetical protein
VPIRLFALLMLVALIGSTCARRVPEPAGVAPGTPHISWVLMYGDGDNADREFACQSEPRSECVLPASKRDEQAYSDIHFYYHGAGNETKYEGTKTLSYLQGKPESLLWRIDIAVKKNESIANESVTGIVSSTPGTYTVTVSLTATVSDIAKVLPIRESFQVVVK